MIGVKELMAKDIERMFLFILHEMPKVWGKDKQKLRDKGIIKQIRNLRKTQYEKDTYNLRYSA